MEMELPAWNNKTEYPGLESPAFRAEIELARTKLEELAALNRAFENSSDEAGQVSLLQKISGAFEQAYVIIRNLQTFVGCELSCDAKNILALQAESEITALSTELSTLRQLRELILSRATDDFLTRYLATPQTAHESFLWREKRKKWDLLLSLDEEKILSKLKPYALTGWGNLYSQISGALKVQMPSKGVLGAAEAAGFLRSADPTLREEAWRGLQDAWVTFEIPCAAVLNNLAGTRIEEARQRSRLREIDFLELPLLDAQVERASIEMMFATLQAKIEVPRRALKLAAQMMQKPLLDPWDLLAPAPTGDCGSGLGTKTKGGFTFQSAIDSVKRAFATVDPSMGKFVDMMVQNQWIEARVLPNKAAGAHSTGFLKSRTPRVFQTFLGSYSEVSTLAHELGHAYHSWVMRDLPLSQSSYTMPLAETASTFAETVLAEHLFKTGNEKTKAEISWAHLMDAIAMLLNIPARFDFEKSFYELRQVRAVSAAELGDLTDQAWRKWFGDELTQTERQYWMTKLHFSIAGVSFYNFPYTFGYLFSLGIYAQKDKWGAEFSNKYVEILRDTACMTAEEVVQKHLGYDIRQPEFWLESLSMIEKNVNSFANRLGSS